MDDNTAVIPVITGEPVVYRTRTNRFYRTVNRVRGALARRITQDAPVRQFARALLANMDDDIREKMAFVEKGMWRVTSWWARLVLARQYSTTAKHKRQAFASCPVRWKLKQERQTFVRASTPLEQRRYDDEDSRFEGLLQQTRAWQASHGAGSAAR